jgi:hypothetical protein
MSDMSSIDEKKEPVVSPTNYTLFIMNYIISIIITIGILIVLIGSLGLYTTKVAQSNILPDNINLAPYTDIARDIKEMAIDMNIMKDRTWTGKLTNIYSQKAYFNEKQYIANFKDTLTGSALNSLKEWSEPTNGIIANPALYLSQIYNSLIANNFAFINTVFLYLSYFPEWTIMLLYGFFGFFIWMALYLFNFCASILYHFTNILNLFRTTLSGDNTKWETNATVSLFGFNRITKWICFWFLWWWLAFISIFLTPIITSLLALISPLQASYKIDIKSKKKMGILDFITDTIVYKKTFIFILATISLLYNSITILGAQSLIGVIVAIIFSYFIGLYTQTIPELNDITNFSQNLANQTVIQAKLVKLTGGMLKHNK